MGPASGDAVRDVSHAVNWAERDFDFVQPAAVGDGGCGGFIYGEESVGRAAGKFCARNEHWDGYVGRADCDSWRRGVFGRYDGQRYSGVRCGQWQRNMEV